MSDKISSIGPVLVFGLLAVIGGTGLSFQVWKAESLKDQVQTVMNSPDLTAQQKILLTQVLIVSKNSSGGDRDDLSLHFKKTAKELWEKRNDEQDANRRMNLIIAVSCFHKASEMVTDPANDVLLLAELKNALALLSAAEASPNIKMQNKEKSESDRHQKKSPGKTDQVANENLAEANEADFFSFKNLVLPVITCLIGIGGLVMNSWKNWYDVKKLKRDLGQTASNLPPTQGS